MLEEKLYTSAMVSYQRTDRNMNFQVGFVSLSTSAQGLHLCTVTFFPEWKTFAAAGSFETNAGL